MNFDEAISQLTDLKAHCQSYADELLRDENADYKFPKPIKLEKRLKDVLEDGVDEKLAEYNVFYV